MPKKIKASPSWSETYYDKTGLTADPEWTLPRTIRAYNAMVKQMAKAMDPEGFKISRINEIHMKQGSIEPWYDYRIEAMHKARVALKAIGITEPKKP